MWRELGSKVRVYWLVRVAAVRLRLDPRTPWSELVAQVHRHAPYPALFRLERLGHDLALAAWHADGPPRGLLCDGRSAGLPQRSLALLHVGMGMAFARRLVRRLRPGSPDAEVDEVLRTFAALCEANSRPGLCEAALEPLGLVVRLFHPRLTAPVDRRLRAVEPRLAPYFWHGAGRALYFVPAHFPPLPGAIRRAAERCRCEPQEADNRLDALAGLFFAAAMVNLRHPEVLAALLHRARLAEEEAEACAVGILTGVLARHDAIPGDPAVAALLAYRPRAVEGLWDRCVTTPCIEGLERLYPLLRASGRLGLLARYRPLAEVYRLLTEGPPENRGLDRSEGGADR